jgi:hypothetical protein
LHSHPTLEPRSQIRPAINVLAGSRPRVAGGFFTRCYNAAMDEYTRRRLPWIGLVLGILIGGFLNKSPDPFSDLIYCGIGGIAGTMIGLVARFVLPKQL